MQTQQVGAMTGGSADGTGIRPPPPSDVRGGPVMTRLRAALASARTTRARRRDERDIQRALAAAPTLESAHEIAALAARR